METAALTVTYTPRPAGTPVASRDLLLVEPRRWGNYCGLLTRANLARYLRDLLYGEDQSEEEEESGYVNCCGALTGVHLPIRVYPLQPGVVYSLQTTIGRLGEPRLEEIRERETISFDLATSAGLRHPALAVEQARWLTGPWTTGGASIPAPPLTVSGQTVYAPVPVYGSVELTLRVRRWTHNLSIPPEEAEPALVGGWTEFAVGLPDGGRPVAAEIEPPPGGAELARSGVNCGRGSGGSSGNVRHEDPPEEQPPHASGANKHIRCRYCELECDEEVTPRE